jgi:hypothetical protein
MKLLVTLLSCVAVLGCGAGGAPESTVPGARDSSREEIAAARETERPPERPPFRKELFDKSHRAAIEFTSGNKVQLDTELKLIEDAIQTDEERAVLELFEAVLNVQTDMNTLWVAKRYTDEVAKKMGALSPEGESLMKTGMPLIYEQYSAYAVIARLRAILCVCRDCSFGRRCGYNLH